MLNKGSKEDGKHLDFIKGKFSELLEVKNFSFLLGAGCSSYKNEQNSRLGWISGELDFLRNKLQSFFTILEKLEKGEEVLRKIVSVLKGIIIFPSGFF